MNKKDRKNSIPNLEQQSDWKGKRIIIIYYYYSIKKSFQRLESYNGRIMLPKWVIYFSIQCCT